MAAPRSTSAPKTRLSIALVATALTALFGAHAQAREVLKVCADPNYMPYSSQDGGGFENRVAEIVAGELGVPLDYAWFPQRMGFIRNTLRAALPEGGYKCDLVMGLPDGYELAVTTAPYYHSTYALVFLKGGALNGVASVEDFNALPAERKEKLRFGMAERNPGGQWLSKHDLLHRLVVAYPSQPGDPAVRPGQLEQEGLLAGDIDATVMWGPIAGYFAKTTEREAVVIPLHSTPDLRLHFAISAGVRFGEGEWKDELNGILEKNRAAIQAVLTEYKVPLVDENGAPL